jgi:hypothetical protein
MADKSTAGTCTGSPGDWAMEIDACHVRSAVLSPRGDGTLIELLLSRPGWRVAARGREAVVLERIS